MAILSDFETAAEVIKKKDYKIAKGTIIAVSPKEENGKKRYGLRISDFQALENKWINGFGSAPGEIGDIIEFEYQEVPVEDRIFYNLKQVINVIKTQTQNTEQESKQIEQGQVIRQSMQNNAPDSKETSNLMLLNDELNRNTTIMRLSVDLAIKEGNYTEQEIQAKYIRFRSLIGCDKLNLGENANSKTDHQEKK